MASLNHALKLAINGTPSLLYVEANSGKGKSRLIREFIEANRGNAIILEGQGLNQGAQRPFQLMVAPAQQLISMTSKNPKLAKHVLQGTSAWQEVFQSILPELGEIYKCAAEENELLRKDQAVRGMIELLNCLGNWEEPIILALDDCQWADELALELLATWLKARPQHSRSHLVIIAAFRSEEVERDHPLRKLKPSQHLILPDLGEKRLYDAVRSMGEQIPEEALAFAIRLAGGSPFMASTIIHGLVEMNVLVQQAGRWLFKAGDVEKDVKSNSEGNFLRKRIELLNGETLAFLKIAAILGKEFNCSLATQICGCECTKAIDEAKHKHILRPLERENHLTFVHDQLRETLLEMLSPEERRLYCLHIATCIEQDSTHTDFELAYFFEAAHEYARALPYAIRSAKEARQRASLEIAEAQYRIASKGVLPNQREIYYSIYQGLGEVLMLRGKYDEALITFEEAKRASSNAIEHSNIERRIGETYFKMGDTLSAAQTLTNALQQVGVTLPRNRLHSLLCLSFQTAIQIAHTLMPGLFLRNKPLTNAAMQIHIGGLLTQLSYVHWFNDCELFSMFWTHMRALNLIEQYKPTPELAHIYSSHSVAMSIIGLFKRGYRYGRRAIGIAKQLETTWHLGQAYNFFGCAALAAANHADCIELCGESSLLLERAGDLWELNIANCNVAYALYRSGDLGQAAELAISTYQDSIGSHDSISAASAISAWSKSTGGNIPIDEPRKVRAMLTQSSFQPEIELAQAEAIALAATGQFDDAIELLDGYFKRLLCTPKFQEYITPLPSWYVTILRLKAEECHNQGSENKHILKKAHKVVALALPLSLVFRNNLPHILREIALLFLLRNKLKLAHFFAKKSISTSIRLGSWFEQEQSLFALYRVECALKSEQCKSTLSEVMRLQQNTKGESLLFSLEMKQYTKRHL